MISPLIPGIADAIGYARRRSRRRAAFGLALLPALVLSIATPTLATAATSNAPASPPRDAAPKALATRTEDGVRVAQAWIRWLPANLPAGGYLTLVNESARTVTLVAVHSPAYASVALHRTLTSGGTARMVPVAGISVPAHATLDFASLGYHLMLTQARQPVQPGQQLPLRLQFADGGTLDVNAQVKPPTAQPSMPAMPGVPGMPGMKNMPGMSH
jgi:hypothetical protein